MVNIKNDIINDRSGFFDFFAYRLGNYISPISRTACSCFRCRIRVGETIKPQGRIITAFNADFIEPEEHKDVHDAY